MTTRRAVLAGGAALALAPWRAAATDTNTDAKAALDAAVAERDPRAALRLLEGVTGRTTSEQLDLATARAGLAVDADIVRLGADPRAKGPPQNLAHVVLLLRRKVGDGIDVAAVETRLEVECRATSARADVLLAQVGVRGATTGARFSALWHDPRHIYASPEAAVADMNRWLDRLRPQVATLVGPVPAICLNVAARLPSPADLAAKHAGYRTLPMPGMPGMPGSYVPDLARLAKRPDWTLPSVVAHELLPGHMVQLPIEAAADPHPLRLEYAPGFAEGWGIYAERLVARAGFYAHGPLAELGYLHWRLFRVGRALVDLDVHLHGLSLADARTKLVAWQGEPGYFAPFDTELTRIAQEPMNRAAEMLFALAIEDGGRGRSHAALLRYHRLVLADGRMRSDELSRRARRPR